MVDSLILLATPVSDIVGFGRMAAESSSIL
jgi:hypothetical protein